jgi:hypothetical protein
MEIGHPGQFPNDPGSPLSCIRLLANVTCKESVTFLWETFGEIDDLDLVANRAALVLPCQRDTSIEELFTCLEQCQKVSIAGGDPLLISRCARQHSPSSRRQDSSLPLVTRSLCSLQNRFRAAHKELEKTGAAGAFFSANTVKEAARDSTFKKLTAELLAFKAEVNKKGAKDGGITIKATTTEDQWADMPTKPVAAKLLHKFSNAVLGWRLRTENARGSEIIDDEHYNRTRDLSMRKSKLHTIMRIRLSYSEIDRALLHERAPPHLA